jgi:hypothetical protein
VAGKKKTNDAIGNQTRDLPACSAVPQSTALPRRNCLLWSFTSLLSLWFLRIFKDFFKITLYWSFRKCSCDKNEAVVTLNLCTLNYPYYLHLTMYFYLEAIANEVKQCEENGYVEVALKKVRKEKCNMTLEKAR